ncbi:MAG TPA: NUDIX hydrolase [Lacipirellulaceae bacterium]|nr:NUDIX hydrolase [Lacipirellulaceae bacterium]
MARLAGKKKTARNLTATRWSLNNCNDQMYRSNPTEIGQMIAWPERTGSCNGPTRSSVLMSTGEQVLLKTRRFTVVEKTVTRPNGETLACQFVRHPGSVAILPLLDDGRICLIHSHRLTVEETLIEVPAGTREPNESPLETARRELAEETGYRATSFEELTSYFPSPGISSERIWIFVARGLTEGQHAREANEEIENLLVSCDEAFRMIDRGEIHDGKTLVAILLWEHKRRLAPGNE